MHYPIVALAVLVAAGAAGCSESIETSTPFKDETPPQWAPEDTAEVIGVGRTHASLTWPPASDDLGVASYRIFVDGKPTKIVHGTSHMLTLLQPDTAHEIHVQAIDRAGRASTDALSVIVKTKPVSRPPPRSPSP